MTTAFGSGCGGHLGLRSSGPRQELNLHDQPFGCGTLRRCVYQFHHAGADAFSKLLKRRMHALGLHITWFSVELVMGAGEGDTDDQEDGEHGGSLKGNIFITTFPSAAFRGDGVADVYDACDV